MKIKPLFVIAAFVIFFGLLLPAPSIAADESVVNKGFSISPAMVEEWFNLGESKTKTIYITNNIGKDTTFTIEVEDFDSSSDPTAGNILLGDGKSAYSLKDYLKPEVAEIRVESGKTAPLKVSVGVPEDSKLPGLYGAVLVKQKVEDASDKSTTILPRIGALFYVGIEGNFPTNAQISDFKYTPFEKLCENGEVKCDNPNNKIDKFDISFVNNGKTHIALSGDIKIVNLFGKTTDTIKLKPWYIMPTSLKARDIEWQRTGTLLGVYKVTLALHDSHSNSDQLKSIYIWFLPWPVVLSLFVLALGLLFLLKFLRKNFRIVKLSRDKKRREEREEEEGKASKKITKKRR